MKTNVIFLDIDGCLNRCGDSNQGLEQDKVDLLKEIFDATGLKVVLSSTWRKFPDHFKRVLIMMESIGHSLYGVTPILDQKTSGAWGSSIWTAPKRGDEILGWLMLNPEVTECVILDDDDDAKVDGHYFAHTNSYVGLTRDIADAIIAHCSRPDECVTVKRKDRIQ